MMGRKKMMMVRPLIPKITLRRVIDEYKMNKGTQIEDEALTQLSKTISELIGWIIREAERHAYDSGGIRITSEHINDAVRIYFGGKE